MLKYDLEAVPLVFQNCMCRFKYTFAPKKLKPEEPLYKHYIRECFYYKPWSLIYYLCIILFLLTYLEIVLSKVWRRGDVGKYAGLGMILILKQSLVQLVTLVTKPGVYIFPNFCVSRQILLSSTLVGLYFLKIAHLSKNGAFQLFIYNHL